MLIAAVAAVAAARKPTYQILATYYPYNTPKVSGGGWLVVVGGSHTMAQSRTTSSKLARVVKLGLARSSGYFVHTSTFSS